MSGQAMAGKVTALVLAGRRDGMIDPLAAGAGVELKCLVPVAGQPMILHVLDALAAAPEISRIIISSNDGTALAAIPEVHVLWLGGRISLVPASPNLVDSIIGALADAAFPVLVTTADNVLLTPDAITAMVTDARAMEADVAVAFARRAAVLAAHPQGQRRFYRFADDAYSNCNSYWISNRAALNIAEVFRQGGQFAKHPLRIIGAFGLLNLIRFHFGIGSLEAAFLRFSRRFLLRIRPMILADGAIAIDVDNGRTLGVAEDIFRARAKA